MCSSLFGRQMPPTTPKVTSNSRALTVSATQRIFLKAWEKVSILCINPSAIKCFQVQSLKKSFVSLLLFQPPPTPPSRRLAGRTASDHYSSSSSSSQQHRGGGGAHHHHHQQQQQQQHFGSSADYNDPRHRGVTESLSCRVSSGAHNNSNNNNNNNKHKNAKEYKGSESVPSKCN